MTVSSEPSPTAAKYASPIARAKAVFAAWLSEPTQVASVVPSSSALTHCLADRHCVREASLVVDLGPGTGGTTQALLREMRYDSRLLAIEKTDAFIEPLSDINDPRLHIQYGDAVELAQHLASHDLGSPDVVLSGVPFSSVPPRIADQLISTIYDCLRPGGVFIAYQFRSRVRDFAEPKFGPATTGHVWWNLPPLKIFCWTK